MLCAHDRFTSCLGMTFRNILFSISINLLKPSRLRNLHSQKPSKTFAMFRKFSAAYEARKEAYHVFQPT